MGFVGLPEVLILFILPAAILLIAAFCLALATYRRVRRLERRMEGVPPADRRFR